MDFSKRLYREFYGVYLLASKSYFDTTYIGFTVDPKKRLAQHNGGYAQGGAKRTSRKGPWEMILIVHGFPHETIALQFEWAWQNPMQSRSLNGLAKGRKHCNSNVEYQLKILHTLLTAKPWIRLSLNIKWMYCENIPARYMPCLTPYRYGPLLKYAKNYHLSTPDENKFEIPEDGICYFCDESDKGTREINRYKIKIKCINNDCSLIAHLICFSKYFLSREKQIEIMPAKANCPKCKIELIWFDLISFLV